MGGTGGVQYTTEASNRWRKYPVNFVLSGYYSNYGVAKLGNEAGYWTSHAETTNTVGVLKIQSDGILGMLSYKYNGYNIRCITR